MIGVPARGGDLVDNVNDAIDWAATAAAGSIFLSVGQIRHTRLFLDRHRHMGNRPVLRV